MNEDGALFDAGFDDREPFRDTPESGGISLESALRDFGPAALDDLIPRVRALARRLDAAHRAGIVHGALHPRTITVLEQDTSLVKGQRSAAPYIAPEINDGGVATAESDQYALAAITYEWLFGKPITGPANRTVDVKAMPGVDRVTLSKAFTRALSTNPADRFATCEEFCNALAAATDQELPLLAVDEEGEEELDAVGFIPEAPGPFDAERGGAFLAQGGPNVDDVKIVAEETNLTAAQPDLDAIVLSDGPARTGRSTAGDVPSWNPSAPRSSEPARFGGFALILAVIVGAVFGFAAGYMARPRALQSRPPETFATAAPVAGATGATSATSATGATDATGAASARGGSAPSAPASASKNSELPKVSEPPKVAAKQTGRLLVRSSPSGASVTVDGVEKGETPLALRDLDFGAHNIAVTKRGYGSESRRVSITSGRPSRSLDVRLPAQTNAAPRPGTPATIGKSASGAEGRSGETSPKRSVGGPASTTGSLNVDSRPSGATVAINGKPSGTTPLTIDLPPGEYRVLMTMSGFRNFATTVRVVAGERARAAYSLTAQEQE